MRTRARGTPSWPGQGPETGYVGADRSDHLAQAACGRGGPYVFEAQPLGPQKPHAGPPIALDAARQKPRRQAARREGSRSAALAQPLGRLARQARLLVSADLARRKRTRLALPLDPLRHAGRADPQRYRNRARRLASLEPSHRPLAKILRIRSRHPCWPRLPSTDLESHPAESLNPDSAKPQHALERGRNPCHSGARRRREPGTHEQTQSSIVGSGLALCAPRNDGRRRRGTMQLRGNWNYPTSIRFGAGRIAELPEAVKAAGMRRPLLVTDPRLGAMPMVKDAAVALQAAGLPCAVFSDL